MPQQRPDEQEEESSSVEKKEVLTEALDESIEQLHAEASALGFDLNPANLIVLRLDDIDVGDPNVSYASYLVQFKEVPGVVRRGLPTVGASVFISEDPHEGRRVTVSYGLLSAGGFGSLETESLEDAVKLYEEKYGK